MCAGSALIPYNRNTLSIPLPAPRYFLAFAYFATYVCRALAYARQGHPVTHATVGAVAYAGGLLHAVVSWRRRRRRDAECGADVATRGKGE